MKIGKYEINTVATGTLGLDGGAMFGVIPKVLWERTNPADEKNRITLGMRCLLLQSDSKKILIDTGVGDHWDSKISKIYRMDKSESELTRSLNKLGVKHEEITDVILTHMHFDHTGGATKFEKDKMVPTFPNATYYIQKDHFNWAKNPSDRDKASFFPERFVPLAEEGVLKLIDGNEHFDDYIQFIVTNGHTFGHQMIKISDSSNTLLYCGDLMPTASHVPLPYIMGYDLQPLVTLDEKKKYLSEAVEENWKIIFEHDPYITTATITKTNKGFVVNERYKDLV